MDFQKSSVKPYTHVNAVECVYCRYVVSWLKHQESRLTSTATEQQQQRNAARQQSTSVQQMSLKQLQPKLDFQITEDSIQGFDSSTDISDSTTNCISSTESNPFRSIATPRHSGTQNCFCCCHGITDVAMDAPSQLPQFEHRYAQLNTCNNSSEYTRCHNCMDVSDSNQFNQHFVHRSSCEHKNCSTNNTNRAVNSCATTFSRHLSTSFLAPCCPHGGSSCGSSGRSNSCSNLTSCVQGTRSQHFSCPRCGYLSQICPVVNTSNHRNVEQILSCCTHDTSGGGFTPRYNAPPPPPSPPPLKLGTGKLYLRSSGASTDASDASDLAHQMEFLTYEASRTCQNIFDCNIAKFLNERTVFFHLCSLFHIFPK